MDLPLRLGQLCAQSLHLLAQLPYLPIGGVHARFRLADPGHEHLTFGRVVGAQGGEQLTRLVLHEC